ncbi:DUF805 domain-containing protein [Maribacter sp. 2308TA10-17]|uniref:DUF805 domain-containing protein n=1 Tax=Maribacter sp. 2308TA10-17 TaxID=3386276 RepID=UPI0039BD7882
MNWYLKALKQYANFSGRARRKEYWMFFLFNILFIYGTLILSLVFDIQALLFVAITYVFVTLVPSLAIGVRRMHDIGKSGWYSLIPYYNIYLICLDSQEGRNKYGHNPKGRQDVILQKV